MKLAALEKILGSLKGAGALVSDIGSQIGREGSAVLKGLGEAGRGVAKSSRLGMSNLPHNLKIDAQNLASVIGKNKLGAGALGAGALGVGGAGAYGVNELLEELGLADDEDEEEGEDPRHAARARAMRGGMR